MPYDRTADFRQLLKTKENEFPDSRRQKSYKKGDTPVNGDLGKQYITEATNILNHITTLNKMLASVRKPYLDVHARVAPGSGQSTRSLSLDVSGSAWAPSRSLSNEERDQIDIQAKTILSRCSERVREMEALEQRRSELIASRTNPLAKILPSRLRQNESTLASDFLAAHHSSITWYLNRRLTDASQNQKEMQEERVKRQLERSRTLGSGAAREALNIHSRDMHAEKPITPGGSGWLGGAPMFAPVDHRDSNTATSYLPSDDEDDDIELSESQILQFEKENTDMLKSVQDTLESVQQAESRLLDISALQMELISHLTRQTEITDQLYEDAIATTSTVEKGNVQLKEAKRRSKDGRLFILVFLLGASFSLLFLHYY